MPDMPQPSHDLPVLHTIRCIGFASLQRIAPVVGVSEAEVESQLLRLAMDGLVTRVPGAFGGWGLTEAGRAADAEQIAKELAAAGTREAFTRAYDRFLGLNPELLDLCTAWQTIPGNGTMKMNDHSDSAYDARVLYRFVDFHRRAVPVCADLATALPRFDRYVVRLAYALKRSKFGDLDYVTDNTASYHAVWFQLHEDLLSTLGISRF
jgi:hypothetical protein